MPLFQQVVQKKFLKELDKNKVAEAYQKFAEHFANPEIQENIRNAKEEEYQEGFVRDLFVNVLGYMLKPQPQYNFVLEKKNEKDSKKSDGAILLNDKSIAVVELKSMKTTDLQAIQYQAFSYKNSQTDCVYVITSNFQKLRFYIDNTVNYEEFDLFNLSLERFEVLYLCLHVENILKKLPSEIKKLSVEQEDAITQKLYNDYSRFKQALFKDILAGNPKENKLLLFKKTQKLLDRFLFLFFAEDKGLIAPNMVRTIIEEWELLKDVDAYQPLYHRFKLYFNYLNKGHKNKRHTIFAYNGGLFSPDEILDNLKITDNLLYNHCRILASYDFDTEIDTNILGHIFEHSLNEVDEMAAISEGTTLDVSKTKRKKDGIFYTPRYITKYMIESTVGELCNKKKIELGIDNESFAKINIKKESKIYEEKLTTYRDWLLKLSILDPACGSGAFLNQALEFLIEEHQVIDDMMAMILGKRVSITDNVTQILENNIFGVDINEESVDIAKLSLWLRTAKVGRKLNDLNNNIKCGNSLISDPEIAGDSAFDWYKEFPAIFREKSKQVWHITCVMHNTRTSQRMIAYNVKKGEPEYLQPHEEVKLAEIIRDIAIADDLNIIKFNICADHVHFVLVAENETEMTNIVRKIKSISARQFNIWRGITLPQTPPTTLTTELTPLEETEEKNHSLTMEQAPLNPKNNHLTMGLAPLEKEEEENTLLPTELTPLEETEEKNHSLTMGLAPLNPKNNHLTMGLAPLNPKNNHLTMGLAPLEKEEAATELEEETMGQAPLSGITRGETQHSLWAQKFNRNLITSDEQLNNTLNYIENNRIKHELPENPDLQKVIESFTKDWETAMKPTFDGGFDIVIGNPPYVFARGYINNQEKDYYAIQYVSTKYQVNTYMIFMEKSVNLLKTHGISGLIVPNSWLMISSAQKLRAFLLENTSVQRIVNLSGNAFEDANVETIIIVNAKNKTPNPSIIILQNQGEDFVFLHHKNQASFQTNDNFEFNIFADDKSLEIISKMKQDSEELDTVASVKAGLQAYEIGKGNPRQSADDVKNRIYDFQTKINDNTFPYLEGKDVNRYYIEWSGTYLLYGEQLAAPRTFDIFSSPKIIIREITGVYPKSIIATYTEEVVLFNRSNIVVLARDKQYHLKYILGLLNSKLLSFYFLKNTSKSVRQMFPKIILVDLRKFPIKRANEYIQTPFINFTENIMNCHKKLRTQSQRFLKLMQTTYPTLGITKKLETWYDLTFGEFRKELEKQKIAFPVKELMDYMELFETHANTVKSLQQQIAQTEKEIDNLVYQLYGLTEEEIKVVESGF